MIGPIATTDHHRPFQPGTPGGGGSFTKIVRGCACRTSKSDYLYTNFLPNFPPISIPFSKEKHPIWIKLGAFYNNLPKIHPIYVIWAPSSLTKTPDRYTKFREKVPQKAGTYRYTTSMWEPPRAWDSKYKGQSYFKWWPMPK